MRRRSSNKDCYTPPKHRRTSLANGSLEIKDAKDGVLTRCPKPACRDVVPICFTNISKKCAHSGITARWYHISVGEHFCTACFEEISRPSGALSNQYKNWVDAWAINSKSQPTHRLFVAEEKLPYWVQCNFCEKWRCLSKEVELDSNIIADFSCQSNLPGDFDKNCAATEDVPFYQPNENGKAMCIRPDVMEYDELLEFPEYARAPVLYLGLRNLIVALWNLDPTQWLTPSHCRQHLICRGLVRILCAKELLRILCFLNRKGIVNYGVLCRPTYPLLNYDIRKQKFVVVGAGVSGLAAARQLENFGAQVTVLEARMRIGGRIWDDFRLGVAVGRGAQLVTGIVNNPIIVMCLQSGVKYRKMEEACPLIAAETGSIVSTKTDKRVDFHFNAMLDAVEDWRRQAKRDENLDGALSYMHGQFLKHTAVAFSAQEQKLLNFHLSNLEYSCGAPLTEVSSLHWDQNEHFAQFAGQHALMSDGCSSIVDRLADGLDIRTEFEVNKIDYTGTTVKIFGKSGKPIICNKVLVTLPLALLQWQSVEFSPALPDAKIASISALGAGIIEKVALKFSTKFWQCTDGADYFGNVPESEDVKNQFTIFYDFSAKHPVTKEYTYVLMSYLSGKAAKMVRYKNDEEIVDMAVQALRRLFPDQVVPEPENYLVTHWWEDQCSGMSYSFVKVGSSGSDYDVIAEEVNKKVYFAGEATNRHFPQTITGAYLSGLREAAKIAAK